MRPPRPRPTPSNAPSQVKLNPLFARPGEATELPRTRLPQGESLPETAYQIVHDEAMLDGNARLNLATFVAPGWTITRAGSSSSRRTRT